MPCKDLKNQVLRSLSGFRKKSKFQSLKQLYLLFLLLLLLCAKFYFVKRPTASFSPEMNDLVRSHIGQMKYDSPSGRRRKTRVTGLQPDGMQLDEVGRAAQAVDLTSIAPPRSVQMIGTPTAAISSP